MPFEKNELMRLPVSMFTASKGVPPPDGSADIVVVGTKTSPSSTLATVYTPSASATTRYFKPSMIYILPPWAKATLLLSDIVSQMAVCDAFDSSHV